LLKIDYLRAPNLNDYEKNYCLPNIFRGNEFDGCTENNLGKAAGLFQMERKQHLRTKMPSNYPKNP
jgi:hypothetical protein